MELDLKNLKKEGEGISIIVTSPQENQDVKIKCENGVKEERNNNDGDGMKMEDGEGDLEGQKGGGEGQGENEDSSKRRRKRKHRTYQDICKQLEFYFSDANITKNRLMQDLIQSSEFVKLETFLEFNRIKGITTEVEDLKKALVNSEKLVLSQDSTGVKRKIPFDMKKVKTEGEVEECTVYVENVPRHTDHAWLEQIFQTFGPLAYISLPKFKHSGQPKGFAFIEFETKECAQACVEAYEGEGSVLTGDMDPAKLMSVQTFQEEQEVERKNRQKQKGKKGGSPEEEGNPRKRKLEEVDNSEVKVEGSSTPPEEEEGSKAKRPREDVTTPKNPSQGSESVHGEVKSVPPLPPVKNKGTVSTSVTTNTNKKRKKNRKKNKWAQSTTEERMEGDSIHLRVMPKQLWRQLRNRYLNLQRKNMAKLKQQLKDHHLRATHYQNSPPVQEVKTKAGNILEIRLDNPVESVEGFKKQIQCDLACQSEDEAAISQFVQFVDYEEGREVAYVRFGDDECFTERINEFVQNAERVFKSAKRMTVEECLEYKAQVQEALKHKRKQNPRKKERGKDRLLKAAAKASQHIRFDEEDYEVPPPIKEEEQVAEISTSSSTKMES